MSKSKGNVVDPLIMMDKYGTDAFRFSLAIFAAQGRDVVFNEKRIEGYRSFINKIWNATKFILMNLGEDFKPGEISTDKLENFDKWILDRLNKTIANVTKSLEEYKFNDAAQEIYEFWWHEFCDWYVELTKQRVYSKEAGSEESSETARQVLFYILTKSLHLMHPFMPFLTEEIWDRITDDDEEKIIISKWPEIVSEFNFPTEAEETEIFKDIVYKIRNVRGEMNIPPDKKASVVFKTENSRIISVIKREEVHIKALAKVDDVTVDAQYTPDNTDASAVLTELEIFLPLKGLIDLDKEKARLEKEIAKVQGELDRVTNKLSNDKFISKAPANVIEKEKNKRDEYSEILSKLNESLGKIQ